MGESSLSRAKIPGPIVQQSGRARRFVLPQGHETGLRLNRLRVRLYAKSCFAIREYKSIASANCFFSMYSPSV